jgi:uncharacterized membrane protein
MGITPFGWLHTVISIVAVIAGIVALVRDKQISTKNLVGKVYVVMTILSCLTGFFIFHHGGISPGHILGVITLAVLGIAGAAEHKHAFGRASQYVATIGYSLTFFFHMIPTLTEGSTRLPTGAPLASSPDDPKLRMATGVVFLLFLIGAALQAKRLHAESR